MSINLVANLLKGRLSARGLKNTLALLEFYLRQFFEHSTLKKILNMGLVKVQKTFRIDKVMGMPYRYVIDPINVCNLRCPICPTGLGTLARPRGKLDLNKYKGIIDQIKPYAYGVYLYNWGEPFLHPEIFEIINYASSKRIAVKISSNLNHFNQEMAERTVESGLDSIMVSIDGATQEVYEKYRRHGNLAKVLSNLTLLVEAKRKANSTKPFIYVRMLINRYNENQVKELRSITSQLGINAFTVGSLFVDTTDKEQVKEWLPEKSEYSFYDRSAEELTNVWHCADLWESMTINWDGGLAPCCWLHDKKNDYENVFDRPIREIWNGDAYVSSRRVFAIGGAKKGTVETICTRCKGHPLYLKD